MREYEDAMLNVQGKHVRVLDEKHVVGGMLRSTRFDWWTIMVELEWGIRVAQQNMVKVWLNWCCAIC